MDAKDLDILARMIAQIVDERVSDALKQIPAPKVEPFDPQPLLDLIAEQAGLSLELQNLIATDTTASDLTGLIDKQAKTIADLQKRIDEDTTANELRGLLEEQAKVIAALQKQLDGITLQKGDKGDKGDVGDSPTPEAVAAVLRGTKEFVDQARGDKGDKGDDGSSPSPDAVAEVLRGTKEFVDQIRGEKGDKGDDGVDRPILDVMQSEPKMRAAKNDLVTHKGSVWQAIRKTSGDPDIDPQGWRAVLGGYANLRMYQQDERTFNFVADSIDGEVKGTFYAPTPLHKGVHEIGRPYDRGDEVLKGGCTFRAKEATDTAPPGPLWQMIAQSKAGKRGDDGVGKQGVPGVRGHPGRGIKSVVATEDMFIITYDDDTVEEVTIEKLDTPEGETE